MIFEVTEEIKRYADPIIAGDHIRLALELKNFAPATLTRTNFLKIWHFISEKEDIIALEMWLKAHNDHPELQIELLVLAASNGFLKSIDIFIENNISIDGRDSYGQTPLHMAIINDQVEFAEKLIELGSDIDKPPHSPFTDWVLEKMELMKEHMHKKELEIEEVHEVGR